MAKVMNSWEFTFEEHQIYIFIFKRILNIPNSTLNQFDILFYLILTIKYSFHVFGVKNTFCTKTFPFIFEIISLQNFYATNVHCYLQCFGFIEFRGKIRF